MFAKNTHRARDRSRKFGIGLLTGLVLAMLAGLAFTTLSGCRVESAGAVNREKNTKGDVEMEEATFAAGCFWGVEAAFRKVKGVRETMVGYTGGHTENPTYEEVCTDTTGHAEAVHVKYDPSVVSYEELLDVFWDCHNPTTRNRQGPDVGSQYRSAVFYHTPEQKAAAEASKKKLDDSEEYSRPVVTEIVPAQEFYRAEEYHQQYLEKRGRASCNL